MKNIKTLVSVGLVLGGFALFSESVYAWGPERTTYTNEEPASSAVFNSITNNAAVGDERDFVRIVKVGAKSTYSNEVELEDGAEYEVYIYYHNNASSTYNTKDYEYRGVARETRLASAFPASVKSGEKGTISATISSSTTNPAKVWDEAYVRAADGKEFTLAFKDASAKIYNDWKANGSVLSTALFSEAGTLLGLNDLNGLILGCDEYSGQVVYRLIATEVKGEEPEPETPEEPKFYIKKLVSTDGGENWLEKAEAKPGDALEFKLKFENIGTVTIDSAYAFDTLQMGSGMEYVEGSTRVKSADGKMKTVEDGLFQNGVSLGKIEPGETVEIYYEVNLSEDKDVFACGTTKIYNGASVSFGSEDWKGNPDGGSGMATLYDKVEIEVKRDDCAPEELPTTGPAEVILAIIVILGIGAGIAYYITSRKAIKKLENDVKGNNSSLNQ